MKLQKYNIKGVTGKQVGHRTSRCEAGALELWVDIDFPNLKGGRVASHLFAPFCVENFRETILVETTQTAYLFL